MMEDPLVLRASMRRANAAHLPVVHRGETASLGRVVVAMGTRARAAEGHPGLLVVNHMKAAAWPVETVGATVTRVHGVIDHHHPPQVEHKAKAVNHLIAMMDIMMIVDGIAMIQGHTGVRFQAIKVVPRDVPNPSLILRWHPIRAQN